MAITHLVAFSLGSNLGDRLSHLHNACAAIEAQIGKIQHLSPVYETPPWGFDAETAFLNMCATCFTTLSAEETLEEIHRIEKEAGRIRTGAGYISRTLDIDIIFFGEETRTDHVPLLPHPCFRERKFVLVPLNDIAPNYTDPVSHLTVSQLLEMCPDDSPITLYQNDPQQSE